MIRYEKIGYENEVFKNYPHVFKIDERYSLEELSSHARMVMNWCVEQFGPVTPRLPSERLFLPGRWFATALCVGFSSEIDAFNFKMRWC